MPHEAKVQRCPVTGAQLLSERRPASASPPFEEPPAYKWVHSLHPFSQAEGEGPAEAEPSSSLCGRVVDGKYRIDALIGRGGMGAVYRAENIRIGKRVAIKILLKGHAKGSEAERRFVREARIAGSLGHPHICEVIDLGTLENGAPYQVMELLEGRTLAERIKLEGALSFDEVLDYAEQVLSALAAAHARGIVHRDLKPENIFLHERGEDVVAKLLDFGVSKSLAGDHGLSLTQTGVVVGTPYYLAPEQARGDRDIDHRVDVWAMGVVLYEALTGCLPFKADSYHALLAHILHSRPRLPSEHRPQIPPAIEGIVLRALAFEPADRFASADEMRSAIREARGRASPSRRHSFRALPDAPPLVAPAPTEATVRELRASQVQGGPDDPTEVSDRLAFVDVDVGRTSRS
jgi:serine/threonine-protein kinase